MGKMMNFLETTFPDMNWVEDWENSVYRGTYKNKTYEIPFEVDMTLTKQNGIKGQIQQFRISA